MIRRFSDKSSVAASDFEGLLLGLNNGDKSALEEVLKKWKFKDIESLMKYAIAVLLKAEGGKLYAEIGGTQTPLVPSDHLLVPKPPEPIP